MRGEIKLAMPWQLAQAKRPKRSEPRPIVELTPHVDIHELRHIIPRDHSTYIYSNDFKYPFAKSLILSTYNIEFQLRSGYNQRVGIHWVHTYFGRGRPIFVCDQCHGGARRLFLRYGHLACRHCHKLSYASRQCDHITRKRLAASKLRLKCLGGLPSITEPLPPKPKWQRKRTYQRIANQIQSLEAKAKTQHCTKPINTRLFVYHIA
jgi:hypothetical protein